MSDSTMLPQQHHKIAKDLLTTTVDKQLFFVRCLWLIFAPVLIALTCFFFPLQLQLLQTVCSGNNCSSYQPTPATLHDLAALGLSLRGATIIILSVIGLCALTWLAVALILAWKNFSKWFALSVSLLALVQTAMAARPPDLLNTPDAAWQWVIVYLLANLNSTMYVVVGTLFPNGKLTPRWTRLILPLWLLIGLPTGLLSCPSSPLSADLQQLLSVISIYCWFVCIAAVIVAQVYRYRYLYRPIERQQTKWVLFFGGIALLEQIVQLSLGLILPGLRNPGSLFALFSFPDTKLFLTLLGLSLLFAMLRYRLWDIDVLINRTLVYGLLTTLLALLYGGLVVILQTLVHNVTGETGNSPLVLVVSTLVIAALFLPLRAFLQRGIDRRFYRRKYDAAKVVEGFSTTIHSAVDLNELQGHLLSAVEQTMQPTHLSLWLRPSAKRREGKR